MASVISIRNLSKTYGSGRKALNDINLDIHHGEIFALLGPNGAGKTTLISTICGIVKPTGGTVTVNGHDIVKEFREARTQVGLVPQELPTDAFERVWNAVVFSRGLFGKPADPEYLADILKKLSLWDRRKDRIKTLSGGMRRRLLIAKALAHEPAILFLDEPTAGVDVELRKDMWDSLRQLQAKGVTIILTTHYLEEAENLADRICVINHGEILLVEEKSTLMAKLGKKQMMMHLRDRLEIIPPALDDYPLILSADGTRLTFTYDSQSEQTGITALLDDLGTAGIAFTDLSTNQSSLEEIFIDVVGQQS